MTSSTEVLGKPVGSDEKNHKTTYVTLKGLEASAKEVEERSKHSVELLSSLVVKNEFLTNLMMELVHRKK